MGVNAIAKNLFNGAVNIVKKHPVVVAGGLGVAGLLTYGALSVARSTKIQNEAVNRFYLTNPILNPLGCWGHMFNPADTEANALDGPIVKYIVDRNNKYYQERYDNLTPQQKVQEFYNNGGRGIHFDAQA